MSIFQTPGDELKNVLIWQQISRKMLSKEAIAQTPFLNKFADPGSRSTWQPKILFQGSGTVICQNEFEKTKWLSRNAKKVEGERGEGNF